jgi:hypothetical protein
MSSKVLVHCGGWVEAKLPGSSAIGSSSNRQQQQHWMTAM